MRLRPHQRLNTHRKPMAANKPQRCVLELPASGEQGSAPRPLVLDTNIVLDLLVFADEAIAPVRTLLAAGRLQWIATRAMRDELERVLAYPQIVPRLAFYGLTAEQALARYDESVHWVSEAQRIDVVCKDADDQHFMDLAVAHNAILLSKDKAVICMRKRLQVLGADVATALELRASQDRALER